jgi:hypothetical protein
MNLLKIMILKRLKKLTMMHKNKKGKENPYSKVNPLAIEL